MVVRNIAFEFLTLRGVVCSILLPVQCDTIQPVTKEYDAHTCAARLNMSIMYMSMRWWPRIRGSTGIA